MHLRCTLWYSALIMTYLELLRWTSTYFRSTFSNFKLLRYLVLLQVQKSADSPSMLVLVHKLFLQRLVAVVTCIVSLVIIRYVLRWKPSFHPSDCSLSYLESDHFICEPDYLWTERKRIYANQDSENMIKRKDSIFFLSNWEPNFHCSHTSRVGRMGDGGKWVCDLFRLKHRPDCLVYSVGSNGDFSFESSMKNIMPHCEIHTFDSNLYKCPNQTCSFHQMIFGNGTHPKDSKTWKKVIQNLNHANRFIDILKIDIEGAEYDFFPSMLTSTKISLPRQVLVELHPRDANDIHQFFEELRANNYVIFNKEPNLIAGAGYFEYTFLKLHSSFFSK